MKKPPQVINPLIRFRNKAQGRYANRISGANHGRAITLDETKCFYVVSASVGDPDADWFTVCFNTVPQESTCLTTDFDFVNQTNPNPLIWGIGNNPGGNCLQYQKGTSTEFDSSGPGDTLEMSYTPGTCRKDASTEDECLLEAISGYSVTNNIWGPTALRVGDFADNQVNAFFPTSNPPSVIGNAWEIFIGGAPQTITNSVIVDNRIDFTLQNTVQSTDTVTISQTNINQCQASNGQYCWRFRNKAVVNNVGVDFWIKEDNDAWLIENAGRWQLG